MDLKSNTLCYLQKIKYNKIHLKDENTKRWKKIYRDNNNKKIGVAILMSDKVDFRVKTITRDKEGHFTVEEISSARGHLNNLCT